MAVPAADQFLEVLETIERLNVEAERLVKALAAAQEYMSTESHPQEGPSHDPE